MKEFIKKGFNILSWAILIVLSCTLIYCIYTYIDSDDNNDIDYIFGYRPIIALSGSMEPYILTNGVAISKQVNSIDDIVVGDVITYKFEDGDGSVALITHRIISLDETTGAIRTKGDNNNVDDGFDIYIDDVEGKVVSVFNQSAWIYDQWERGFWGKFFLVMFPISLIVLYYIIKSLIKSWLNNKKDNELSEAEEISIMEEEDSSDPIVTVVVEENDSLIKEDKN